MENEIRIPPEVNRIIEKLEKNGYEAYAVGGCVRDVLLGRQPSDWDITTSAFPEQVKSAFSHTADTGIAHGTVTVLSEGGSFEVTTYRIDGDYEDGRHPNKVTYIRDLSEDLKRRDFTVNAMAYNERTGLVDLFGGRDDLKTGLIRCVGESRERFTEDALRILRAVRFAAQLDFKIEEKTAEAASLMASSLRKISAERIQSELSKLLVSPHPEKMALMWELGITKEILPVFDRMMEQTLPAGNSVGEHTIRTLEAVRADRVLRWTMLLHDCGKPDTAAVIDGKLRFLQHAAAGAALAGRIMRSLKMDRDTMDKAQVLITWHTFMPEPDPASVRQAVNRIGENLFPLYLEVKRADITVREEPVRTKRLDVLTQIVHIYEEILERGDCLSLKDLKLTGSDLLEDGMQRGPQIGMVLKQLLEEVLREPSLNERTYLLARSRQLRNKQDAGSCVEK